MALQVALMVDNGPGPNGTSLIKIPSGQTVYQTHHLVGILGPDEEDELQQAILQVGKDNRHFRFIVLPAREFMVTLDDEGKPKLNQRPTKEDRESWEVELPILPDTPESLGFMNRTNIDPRSV